MAKTNEHVPETWLGRQLKTRHPGIQGIDQMLHEVARHLLFIRNAESYEERRSGAANLATVIDLLDQKTSLFDER